MNYSKNSGASHNVLIGHLHVEDVMIRIDD